MIEQVIVAEQLSRTLAGLMWIWGVTALARKILSRFGTEDQRERFLPRGCKDEQMFSIALTEPDGGTDVFGSMRARAREVDGGWVVNGAKIWSTMAYVANTLLLIARTGEDVKKPSQGLTSFLCDAKGPG